MPKIQIWWWNVCKPLNLYCPHFILFDQNLQYYCSHWACLNVLLEKLFISVRTKRVPSLVQLVIEFWDVNFASFSIWEPLWIINSNSSLFTPLRRPNNICRHVFLFLYLTFRIVYVCNRNVFYTDVLDVYS